MISYYSINFTLNTKLKGSNEYIRKFNLNLPNEMPFWKEPKFIGNIQNEKIDFEPYLLEIELFNSSKINDLIMNSGPISKKLIVSDKLKLILEKHREGGMQFFKINIFQKNITQGDYWILNVYEVNMEFIDFTRSVIYETENVFNYKNESKINSFDEFVKFKKEIEIKGYPSGFIIDKVKLKDNIKSDFFTLLHVEGGIKYVVSEKLKNEIEHSGCKGIEFMPIEMKYTEWLQGGEREKIYGKV